MKIAPHAELVLMSVRWKQYLKATSIRSIRIFAPIAEHVQMYARLRQFILNNLQSHKKHVEPLHPTVLCVLYGYDDFYSGRYFAFASMFWTSVSFISSSRVTFLFPIIYDSTILKPSHTEALPGDSFVK